MRRTSPAKKRLVSEFAKRVNSSLIYYIPRDRIVQLAELNRKTVLEYAPDSEQATVYRSLAARIMENNEFTIPNPLEIDDLESLALEFI